MKLLIITNESCDLADVLRSCPAETKTLSFDEAIRADICGYDAFCVFGDGGMTLDARLRLKLENEADRGKRIFLESIGSFRSIYSAGPVDTTRSRLIYLAPDSGEGIPGLRTGNLLDDEAGQLITPWFSVPGTTPLLVFKEQIIAHTHTDAAPEEILKNSRPGMFKIGDNILWALFNMRNFNKARFAPRGNWEKLVKYICRFLTDSEPRYMPEPVVRYGTDADLNDPAAWEDARKTAVENGIRWLRGFLVDGGCGGIREGVRHNILPDGAQLTADTVRNDCCGEAAGAFYMYGHLTGDKYHIGIAENIRKFMHEVFVIRKDPFYGMMRWSYDAWNVCYPDDVARAVFPALLGALYMDDERFFADICSCLDFLVSVTCRDGLPHARYDIWNLDVRKLEEIRESEHGLPSAHYTAYYLAALLLAYKKCGKTEYLETARKGLETIMSLYPETRREQSETQEMCRLIFPLAALYDATGEEKHKELLFRVTHDLEKHRHPFGGYREWDTGYKASCSRESTGECSLLTENGDPVTDSLYSMNWLPIGFAYAYYATNDLYFYDLWKNVITFYLRTQMYSANPLIDGAWCRAFDMDLEEAYGCPHDVGWAANCCESGWTVSEILMGMMLMDIFPEKDSSGQ
ncbi:MAG: hypothetical protein GX897_04845 [Clostridiales bacterium]|nr:hypothetical protein [Clostridiales bacterium]